MCAFNVCSVGHQSLALMVAICHLLYLVLWLVKLTYFHFFFIAWTFLTEACSGKAKHFALVILATCGGKSHSFLKVSISIFFFI